MLDPHTGRPTRWKDVETQLLKEQRQQVHAENKQRRIAEGRDDLDAEDMPEVEESLNVLFDRRSYERRTVR